ncbi:MAG: hypothetical protein IT521_00230 [Burkholderiales bacterium]|nr:hypothetical protein [Burkholderiales bacterium]
MNSAAEDAQLSHEVSRNRDVMLRLLSVTASLAGLCIAALGFMEFGSPEAAYRTLADEVIAFDAMLFVGCVYLILWALRTHSLRRARMLGRVIDGVFLIALTTMLLAATYIVYWVL